MIAKHKEPELVCLLYIYYFSTVNSLFSLPCAKIDCRTKLEILIWTLSMIINIENAAWFRKFWGFEVTADLSLFLSFFFTMWVFIGHYSRNAKNIIDKKGVVSRHMLIPTDASWCGTPPDASDGINNWQETMAVLTGTTLLVMLDIMSPRNRNFSYIAKYIPWKTKTLEKTLLLQENFTF